MGMIASHLGMLVSMWVVLAIIGLNALLRLAEGLRGKTSAEDLSTVVTRPILLDILPLVLLALLTTLPAYHIVMLIWFYVAAALIAIRGLLQLGKALKSLT